MKFSVIVPVYNRADTIRPALESVRGQTHVDFECLVVDDGSADGEALRAVVEGMNDARFRYIRRENGGGGAARNTGIDAAKGEFIAFLDSDDLFLPEKLERYASVVTDDPRRAWYSQTLVNRGVLKYWVRPVRGIGPEEDMGEYLFVANQFVPTPTIVASTAIARELPFDPGLRKGQDLDLCVRWHAAGVRFTMLNEPLTVWTDDSEDNRASRQFGWEAPTKWLEEAKPMLTRRAYLGYRATVLAYYLAGTKPMTALACILQGWARAGVPSSVAARQIARSFLPRATYRWLVNMFVSLRGRQVDAESSTRCLPPTDWG